MCSHPRVHYAARAYARAAKINTRWRFGGRDMNQSNLQIRNSKIQCQRPTHTRVAIAAHNFNRRPDLSESLKHRFIADITQMPNLIRIRNQLRHHGRKSIVSIRNDRNPHVHEFPQPRSLVLCNRYGLPIAARSLREFQGASEAPVSAAILAERATQKFAQRTAARRVKMARRLRCSSVTGRRGHARCFGGGPF
jgi:hypothetical protein